MQKFSFLPVGENSPTETFVSVASVLARRPAPPSPPGRPLCTLRRGEQEPLGLRLPAIPLALHILKGCLELAQAFLGQGKPQAKLGSTLGDLRHCLGRCLGRCEHPMQLDRLDGPCAQVVPAAGNTASLDGSQDG
jgi:hypothetical protein